MITYTTLTGNTYIFRNGRVTCDAHNMQDEPVFGPVRFGPKFGYSNRLFFRIARGQVVTSTVMEVSRG